MGAGSPQIAGRNSARAPALSTSFDMASVLPRLVARDAPPLPSAPPRRTRIWEFNTNLHCSIIGTCLSTGELRHTLRKLGLGSQACSDHELHGVAVTLAGRHNDAARQLHKALDQRHKLAVSQFAKAATEADLRAQWTAAVRRGEIPGAYWATLTHAAATPAIIREAFGVVHMLSHLVGSANRADIRRLCELEAEKADLSARLDRQQLALHDAVATRDAQIHDLRRALAQRIVSEPDAPHDDAALSGLVADLERRLGAETRRRTALQDRLASAQDALSRERAARLSAERSCEAMRRELSIIEASLAPSDAPDGPSDARWDGATMLYVGARPNQIAPMRAAVERRGATFLHHDGGIENHPNLLPGLTSRAHVVLFPVDCISHDAASAVKSLCRQAGKRFIPLRSASITSLVAALQAQEVVALADTAP